MGAAVLASMVAIFIIYVRYRGTRNPPADRQAESTPLTAQSQPSEINSLRSMAHQSSFAEETLLTNSQSTRDLVQPFGDVSDSKQRGALELTSVDDDDNSQLYEASV